MPRTFQPPRSLTEEQIEALEEHEAHQYRSSGAGYDLVLALETIARLRVDAQRSHLQLRMAQSNCAHDLKPCGELDRCTRCGVIQ